MTLEANATLLDDQSIQQKLHPTQNLHSVVLSHSATKLPQYPQIMEWGTESSKKYCIGKLTFGPPCITEIQLRGLTFSNCSLGSIKSIGTK